MDQISFCFNQSSCVHTLRDDGNDSGFSRLMHIIVFLCFQSIFISFTCVATVGAGVCDRVPCAPVLRLSACCAATDGAVKFLRWPAVHTAPPVWTWCWIYKRRTSKTQLRAALVCQLIGISWFIHALVSVNTGQTTSWQSDLYRKGIDKIISVHSDDSLSIPATISWFFSPPNEKSESFQVKLTQSVSLK